MTMKSIVLKISLLLTMSTLLFFSCINSDVEPDGYGDVYILMEVIDGDTLTGLGMHAFSYYGFHSVTAHHIDNEETVYTLKSYLDKYDSDYVWATAKENYSKETPPKGMYLFEATYAGGRTLTFSDDLYQSTVAPPKITTCEYVLGIVEVEWNRLANADAYNVKMWNAEGNIIFVSPRFNSYISTYSFDIKTDGWQKSTYPSIGDIVTVSVEAFLFEPGSSNYFQCISISKHSFTWGV